VASRTITHTTISQNISFCPPLYLPTSGTRSSWSVTTSRHCRSHWRSRGSMRLARQKRSAIQTNAAAITRPM